MIYSALIFINSNEVRLCFVQAKSLEEARYITYRTYYNSLSKGKDIKIEIYKAECNHANLEEVSITYI
jgi:hypothetical protein